MKYYVRLVKTFLESVGNSFVQAFLRFGKSEVGRLSRSFLQV